MPDGFASLYEFVNEGGASLEVGEWDEAWTMIQEGRPVAALLPRWDMNNQLAGGGRRWHGPQRLYQVLELFDVAEELGEGRLRVRLRVSSEDWLVRLALRLGSSGRVLEPARLASRVAEAARAGLVGYDPAPA